MIARVLYPKSHALAQTCCTVRNNANAHVHVQYNMRARTCSHSSEVRAILRLEVILLGKIIMYRDTVVFMYGHTFVVYGTSYSTVG